MKPRFASGVSARVKRWVHLMYVLAATTLVMAVTAPSASAALPTIYPMAECIPTNDKFRGPVGPAVKDMAGAVGGLIPLVVLVCVVLLALTGIIAVARKRDMSVVIQAIAAVIAIPFVAALAMIIFTAMWTAVNSAC